MKAKMTVFCPHCGQNHAIEYQKATHKLVGLRRVRGKAHGLEYELTTPSHGTVAEGLTLTPLQEMILAALPGGAIGGGLGLGIAALWPEAALVVIPSFTLGGVGIGMSIALDIIKLQYRKLIPEAEAIIESAKPQPSRQEVMAARPVIEVREAPPPSPSGSPSAARPYRLTRIGQCPATNEQMATWAKAVLNRESIAIGNWCGDGRPFTRGEYESLLKWLSQQQPKITELIRGRWVVTTAGEVWLTQYLDGLEAALPY